MATGRLSIVIDAKNRAGREIAEAEGAINKLRASWRGAAIVASALTVAVGSLVVGFDKLATRGGEVANVQRAFNAVFEDGEAAIGKARTATRGLVSNY